MTTRQMHRDFSLARALILFAVIPASGCEVSTGGKAKAEVNCVGGAETIDCEVKHTAGDAAVNVCWDLHFTCANGEIVTGTGLCQSVQPSTTAQKRIPITELTNFAKCDKVTSTETRNFKLSKL